ncbi:MAG: class I SAM-dependent methyltransferase [Bacteroidetes bacterium]|nr:class I SAM-dependent methyltransferase [Bacteroidota bacterium]
MEQALIKIRDQQRESWNKFSPGWKKWDHLMMEFLMPMGDQIISNLNPKDDHLVLDVAAGTGEPGLTIAGLMKNGKVILTDISDKMLEVARENAKIHNVSNFETSVCDVCELPFEDNTFDAISCRFGFMFFPDMQIAAKEMYRVLKPGGKISTAVWHVPEKNYWVTTIGGTINRNMGLTPPPPEAPGMFRCAPNGLILEIFKNAGLKNTSETEVSSKMRCGTADTYWEMMTDVAAPFVAALSNADDNMKKKIKDEVYELVAQRFPDGIVEFDTGALVIYGEK